MPQPLPVGTVLGGRYRITDHVVTSADQDMVFHGADQVLNRRVTVLVASPESATQVASSARELATGERQDDVQVLDLGLSEGRTYLIAGGDPDPDVLLGLAYPQELHVEPFQTDTLGSEIFGQSRTDEAHSYDDDNAYYADLDRRLRADEAKSQRRPGFLNRISERITERVRPADGTAAKAAAGASALAAADAATRAQQEERERAEREAREAEERAEREAAERAEREARETREAEERAEEERLEAEEREAAAREAQDRAEEERLEAEEREAAAREAEAVPVVEDEDAGPTRAVPVVETSDEDQDVTDVAATQATPVVAEAAPVRPPRPAPRRALRDEADEWRAGLGAGTGAAAVTAGAVGAASTAAATTPAVEAVRPAAEEPAAAGADRAGTLASGSAAADGGAGGSSVATAAPAGEPARASSGRSWLLALLLVGALVLAGLGGLFLLAQNRDTVAATPPSASPTVSEDAPSAEPSSAAPPVEGPTSAAPSSEASPDEETSAVAAPANAEPRPVGVERRVPELPALEEENDATLGALIDGDPGSAWQSYAYNRPNFGGYVDSMNLVVELEQPAEVDEVVLQHAGATGGSWIAYLADSPEGGQGDAREIGQGTFDEETVTVPVEVEDRTAGYVILSVTSLPQVDGDAEHPYGLRLTEIGVR